MQSPDDPDVRGRLTTLPSPLGAAGDVVGAADFQHTRPQAPPSRPMQASVLFLRLRDFDDLGAPEQARQLRFATGLTGKLLRIWPEAQRVVLQVPDGSAIVGLDSPALALDAAERAAGHAGLVLVLHHGPVQAVEPGEAPQLRGEAIATAHALAGRPQAQALVATAAFRLALLATDPRRAESLRPAGEFVDPQHRSHALYDIDPAVSTGRRQRRMLVAAGTVAGILGAGFVGGLAREGYEAGRRPAVIRLAIRPSAQVWVDGEFKGDSPPLTRLSIAPGRRTIELRNGRHKPVRFQLQLKPGEQLDITHAFGGGAPPSFWKRFRPW